MRGWKILSKCLSLSILFTELPLIKVRMTVEGAGLREKKRRSDLHISRHPSVEKAMAPYSSTLAWKIPWTEEPGRLQSMGLLGVGHTERLHFHFSLSCIGEGNGNPLQCSCLEHPRDVGVWWAAVYGVAQSRTPLKRLSSSIYIYIYIYIYI